MMWPQGPARLGDKIQSIAGLYRITEKLLNQLGEHSANANEIRNTVVEVLLSTRWKDTNDRKFHKPLSE